MRTLALALFEEGSDEQLVFDSHEQAMITHGNICNHVCCAFYNLIAKYLLEGMDFEEAYSVGINSLKRIYSDNKSYLDEFENKVIGEKFNALKSFFESSEDKGMNFMYNLLELIGERKNKINFARYVYLLARMEPKEDASLSEKENYNKFSQKMYNWIKSEKDCRELITAMNIYSYIQRNNEEEEK